MCCGAGGAVAGAAASRRTSTSRSRCRRCTRPSPRSPARDWRRAWSLALTAQFVARRRFLPEADAAWAEAWRRRLADDARARAGVLRDGVPGAGRPGAAGGRARGAGAAGVAPLRETGHLLLMRALAARGNVAEALAAYERLRVLLREELGVDPCRAVQDAHAALLA